MSTRESFWIAMERYGLGVGTHKTALVRFDYQALAKKKQKPTAKDKKHQYK
jgi:hypothetical protein